MHYTSIEKHLYWKKDYIILIFPSVLNAMLAVMFLCMMQNIKSCHKCYSDQCQRELVSTNNQTLTAVSAFIVTESHRTKFRLRMLLLPLIFLPVVLPVEDYEGYRVIREGHDTSHSKSIVKLHMVHGSLVHGWCLFMITIRASRSPGLSCSN